MSGLTAAVCEDLAHKYPLAFAKYLRKKATATPLTRSGRKQAKDLITEAKMLEDYAANSSRAAA